MQALRVQSKPMVAEDRELAPSAQPATWLKQIEKLRAAGKTTENEQEFRHFRDAYPDYQAPAGPPPADGPTK